MSRRRQILALVLGLSFLAVLGANLYPGSRTLRSAHTRWQVLRGQGRMAGDSLDIDRFYGQFPNANLFVIYDGFAPDRWDDRFWVMHNYYRGSYTLYPRRLYVTASAAVLVEAPFILTANKRPDPAWLRRHEVRYVLTVSRGGSGAEVIE